MRTRIWLTAVAVAAAALTGCTGAGTSSGGSGGKGTSSVDSKEEHKAEDDVQIMACSKQDFGNWPQAKLKVTNHSSKVSDYIVQVEFLDASGTRKAEGTAVVSNLAHGQTAEETAAGLAEVAGKVTCRITDVSRTASL